MGPVRPEWAGEERSGETEWPRVTGSGAVGVKKTELQEEMRWGWGAQEAPPILDGLEGRSLESAWHLMAEALGLTGCGTRTDSRVCIAELGPGLALHMALGHWG